MSGDESVFSGITKQECFQVPLALRAKHGYMLSVSKGPCERLNV